MDCDKGPAALHVLLKVIHHKLPDPTTYGVWQYGDQKVHTALWSHCVTCSALQRGLLQHMIIYWFESTLLSALAVLAAYENACPI